ncbi:MAG: RHS repeat-associated core domain-containing protein [Anaerolineales bacterium]|nr:RHS repeat-associated core domain-containing protein [Anaerolineales bacterium]
MTTNFRNTKYYYEGTQQIAMRKNGTLTYILGDHASTMLSTSLGSTSMITDSSGNVISETKYKACPLRLRYGMLREGETRYSSGTNPTDYTYTGQYSYTDDFGLMFYNARWYDPSLGRFAQADTIVPSGVQGLDRYAYTFNNPIIYTDPSGHNPLLIIVLLVAGSALLHSSTDKQVQHSGPIFDLTPMLQSTGEKVIENVASLSSPEVYEFETTLSVGGSDSEAEIFQDEVLDHLDYTNTILSETVGYIIPDNIVSFLINEFGIPDPAGTENFQEKIDDLISNENQYDDGGLIVNYEGYKVESFDPESRINTTNEQGTLTICGSRTTACTNISLVQRDAQRARFWLQNHRAE